MKAREKKNDEGEQAKTYDAYVENHNKALKGCFMEPVTERATSDKRGKSVVHRNNQVRGRHLTIHKTLCDTVERPITQPMA